MLKQNVRIKSISETGLDISMPKVSLTFELRGELRNYRLVMIL